MAAPNLKEIEWAIHELENEESSESRYAMLAAFYTCRKEMTGETDQSQIAAYSHAAGPVSATEPLGLYGESEFLNAVAGKDTAAAWAVMDEHMDALRMMSPRVYQGVLRKLKNL